jgi:hypothetical protein
MMGFARLNPSYGRFLNCERSSSGVELSRGGGLLARASDVVECAKRESYYRVEAPGKFVEHDLIEG